MINTRKITLLISIFAMCLPIFFLSAHHARAEIVYEFDFDNLCAPPDEWCGWYADNGIWDIGEPTSGPESAYSLPNCAATVLDGNYPQGPDSRLISPAIELPSVDVNDEIVLRFWQWFSYATEHTTADKGEVQIRTYENDNWSSWEPLNTVVLYSKIWSPCQVDLTEYAGKFVQIAFFHVDRSDAFGHHESSGWYIDDFVIKKQTICLFSVDTIEGFESGWGCWWTSNGVWEIGEPTSGPGSGYDSLNCAATVLDGNYPQSTDSYLVSPPIDLPDIQFPDEVVLWFWQWFSYATEHTTADRGEVLISTYEGSTWSSWVTLDTVSSYIPDWHHKRIVLNDYAGKRVRIAFFHVDRSDAFGRHESSGWYIDDVEITGTGNIRPYPPSTPSPSDNEDNVPVDTDLCWEGGDPDPEDTVTYDLYAGTSSPMPLIASDLTETCFDPGTLEECTTYYWKIVAEDNHGARTEGPVWSFTTICPDPWETAYDTLFRHPSDLTLLRQYRDESLNKTKKGRLYTRLLYNRSEKALQVLLQNPELMMEAKDLIDANKGAVSDVLHGYEGVIYNTDEIVSFLKAYARKSPPGLKLLANMIRWKMLIKQKQGEVFLGFRLK